MILKFTTNHGDSIGAIVGADDAISDNIESSSSIGSSTNSAAASAPKHSATASASFKQKKIANKKTKSSKNNAIFLNKKGASQKLSDFHVLSASSRVLTRSKRPSRKSPPAQQCRHRPVGTPCVWAGRDASPGHVDAHPL